MQTQDCNHEYNFIGGIYCKTVAKKVCCCSREVAVDLVHTVAIRNREHEKDLPPTIEARMARARNILLIVFYNENWYIYGIIPFQYALCWYRYLLLSFEWDKSSRFLSVDILDSIQFSMDFFFLLQFKSTYVFPLGTWYFFYLQVKLFRQLFFRMDGNNIYCNWN